MYRYIRHIIVSVLLANLSFQGVIAKSISVHGTDVKQIISPNQVLVYEDDAINYVALIVKDGNIRFVQLDFSEEIQEIKNCYDDLEAHQNQLCRLNSRETFSSRTGKELNMNGAYVTGGKSIALTAGTKLNIIDAILKSPEIYLSCQKFFAQACFVDTHIVQITSTCPDSLIKMIRFHFKKNASIIPFMQGIFDFPSNETDDEGPLVAVGAYKVEIEFAPEVFN